MSSVSIYKRLLGYVKQLKLPFIVATIGNLIYAFMDVLFISLTQPLMDDGLIKGDVSILKLAPLFIIGILIVRGIASVISTYCMAWVGQSVVQKLREELVESYISMPAQFFDRNSSGQLISKVTFNTQQVATASSDAITNMLREGGSIIYAISFMFWTNWRLAAIYFICIPLIAWIVSIASKRFKKISSNIQHAMGGVTETTQEIIEGYKVVKTFGGERYEKARFHQEANKNRYQNLKLILAKAVSVPLIQLIAAMAMAIVMYYSAFEIDKGTLTPGEFVAMMMMMMFILKPLKVISNLNVILQQGITAADSIFQVIDAEKEKETGSVKLTSAPKTIAFNDVSFSYPEAQVPALKSVSFAVTHGQTVALVGKSGSGKSTLTNLLLRFYSPNQGAVLFDGQDINDIQLSSLRNNIAYVSQQVVLFNDSVRANIAYGQETVDEDRLLDAARRAHALEFIDKMANGFDTLIGENGSRLSGGQRQRLAIARAIYKDAAIIVLDEATSALDTESERHIQAALEALTENRTTFVIAHRLSTIENADEIIVMDDGQIIEKGSHQTLMQTDGAYAKLQALQFSS